MQIKSKIINANAGSGKTYQIIKHIASIIEAGHSPSSILCITFTKAGAKEMQDRLKKECYHLIEDQQPKIITFHALCQEIVTMFAYELQMPYQFENMETIEANFLEQFVDKVISLQKVKELILNFNLSYNDVKSVCESFVKQFYNISQAKEIRQRSLSEIFGINYETEIEKNQIYESTLLNPPFEILNNLKGKKVEEMLPQIEKLINNINGDFSKKNFEKYCELILKITNKDLKPYNADLQEKIELLNTIYQYEISSAINECFDDIANIIEILKYHEGKYLFEDMVQKALWVLNNPELKDFALFKFGSTYKHILIDEAQDTNQDQWNVVKHFMEEHIATNMVDSSLFIVGDIKQTIYSFQGAEAGIMNNVYLQYKNYLKEEFLTKSYRTTQPVLDAINKAFEIDDKQTHISNFQRNVGSVIIGKSRLQDGEKTEQELARIAHFVAQTVQNLLMQNLVHEKYPNTKIQPKHIAILARGRHEGTITALREAFYQHRIPIAFNEKIDYKLYNAILDFVSLLKLCILEEDTQALYGILAGSIFGIDETILAKHFYKDVQASEIFNNFPELQTLVENVKPVLFAEGITAFFNEIYIQFGIKYTKQEAEALAKFIENTAKVKQFNFVEYIQNFEKTEQIMLNKPQPENAVTFTTAHSSKGLQYPVVFYVETSKPQFAKSDGKILAHKGAIIYNFNKNDRSPIIQEIIESKIAQMHEEEFRIQYVAISRAEEKFYYICNEYNAKKNDDGTPKNPHAMYHKLEKAITDEFIHLNQDGIEIYEFIKDNF